jgi:hypothetical protein
MKMHNISERVQRQNGSEKIFEIIKVEIFTKLMIVTKSQTQEAQVTLSRKTNKLLCT